MRLDPRIVESKKVEIEEIRERLRLLPKESPSRPSQAALLQQLEEQFQKLQRGY